MCLDCLSTQVRYSIGIHKIRITPGVRAKKSLSLSTLGQVRCRAGDESLKLVSQKFIRTTYKQSFSIHFSSTHIHIYTSTSCLRELHLALLCALSPGLPVLLSSNVLSSLSPMQAVRLHSRLCPRLSQHSKFVVSRLSTLPDTRSRFSVCHRMSLVQSTRPIGA